MNQLKKREIELLVIKFLNKEANKSELIKLNFWLTNKDNLPLFNRYVKTQYLTTICMEEFDIEKARMSIQNKIKHNKRKTLIKQFYKYAVILIVLSGAVFTFMKTVTNDYPTHLISKKEITPGTNKATLTLSNGKKINLKDNIKTKNAVSNGKSIIYGVPKNTKKTQYNTLEVPRGGKFFVSLSDGTKVWLNSETKLKYPVSFKNNETRKVELLYGEAFFDVSKSIHNNNTKFIVKTASQNITVLGTEFNINAYNDNDIVYTTLVEGKIVVSNKSQNKILIPGMQSQINKLKNTMIITQANVTNIIAWKNGFFSFEDEPLERMLKTLSRWYNVSITYKSEHKRLFRFSGLLKRTDNIEELLHNIEKTKQVSFEIKNKEIIVK